MSRPLPEATTRRRLVEQRAPRYSFFQGAATGMKDSGEKSVEQVAHRHFYTLALLFFKRA